jgi:hypothetical protein
MPMLQNTQPHFGRDLDQILDRVYRANEATAVDNDVALRERMQQQRRGVMALKEAMATLRGVREKSQSVWDLKKEISELQEQITHLKVLREQIAALKQQLFEEER